MRRIFKDESHERLFRRDGCVLLTNALDGAAVKRVEEFYLSNSARDFDGAHNSLELQSPEQKAKIHNFLARIFDEHLSRYFHDYKALVATFSAKNPGRAGVVPPHRDWPLVDEARHASLNLWGPLCETGAGNGALGVFKGSHRLRATVHSTNLPSTLSISEGSWKYLTFFHMKPGEVLAFSTQTIHASGPNDSGGERTAASIGIIPSEAQPIHYVGDRLRPSRMLELEVDEAFYQNYRLERGTHVSPSDDHVVNNGGYRGRELEHAPVRIDDRDILRLYEPSGSAAFRRIKDRLRSKLALS